MDILEITEVKMLVFKKFIPFGISTVKRYVSFITDAPEEWELRLNLILSLDREYHEGDLKEFRSFFD